MISINKLRDFFFRNGSFQKTFEIDNHETCMGKVLISVKINDIEGIRIKPISIFLISDQGNISTYTCRQNEKN